nr:hypothetical protein [Tanacetum cinerariifolium]
MEDDYYDDDSGYEINPPDNDYRGGGGWIQDEADKSDDDDSMENESLASSEFLNVRHVGSSENTITGKDSNNDQLCEGQTTTLVTPQRSKPEHSHSLYFVLDTQFKVFSTSAQKKSKVGHLLEVEKTLVNALREAMYVPPTPLTSPLPCASINLLKPIKQYKRKKFIKQLNPLNTFNSSILGLTNSYTGNIIPSKNHCFTHKQPLLK